MIKPLSRLIPYLLKLIKWLHTRKGLFLPFVLIKVFNFLISFIIKAEKVRFKQMVRIIYYFLSAFNLILALIVIFSFSDLQSFQYTGKILELLWEGLHILIPVIILDSINEYIIDLGLFFKNLLRKFIDWIYSGEIKLDPKKVQQNKLPKRDNIIRDPFSGTHVENIQNMDYREFYRDYDQELSTKTSWKTVIYFTILAVGVSYFIYPDLYHAIYYGIKDRLFPGGGGGPGGGTTSGGAGDTPVPVRSGRDSDSSFQKAVKAAKGGKVKAGEIISGSKGTSHIPTKLGEGSGNLGSVVGGSLYTPLDPLANLQEKMEHVLYNNNLSLPDKKKWIMHLLIKQQVQPIIFLSLK
jgi:hypothetical protein